MRADLHLRSMALLLGRALDRRARILLVAALACALAASGLAAAAPIFLKWLLESLSATSELASGVQPAVWIGAFAGCLLAVRFIGEARACLFGSAEQGVVRRISRSAFAHVLALPMEQHLKRSTGELVQTLENGLLGIRLILQQGLFTLLPGLVEIAVIAALMWTLFDAAFLSVFALCAAGYGFVFTRGARRVLRASRSVSSARIRAGARLSDALMNLETVKACSGEARLTERYDESLESTQALWQDFYRIRFRTGAMVALVFAAGLVASLGLAGSGVQDGRLTAGDLVLVNAWMLQLARPVELLGYGLRDIGQGAAFVEKLHALLSEPAEQGLECEPAPLPATVSPAAIEFENVSFGYEGGPDVLRNICVKIDAGQKVAIVGPSGSGKSTLLRMLMRFHEPREGRILFDGQPLSDIPASQLRSQTAFISQSAGLLNESVRFNVMFPDTSGDDARAHQILKRLGIEGLVSRNLEDKQEAVGEGGLRLSGGEKQRVAIARALMRNSRLLLADEPTSALDINTEAVALGEMLQASRALTQVIATHRLAAAADADFILVMDQGMIVECGRHDDLVGAGGTYSRMWREKRR